MGADYQIGTQIPSGVILAWSGTVANIPSGWVFCDGNNGTPDLRDRFIVGAKQDSGGVAKSNITGTLLQSHNTTQHQHTLETLILSTAGAHTHTVSAPGEGGSDQYLETSGDGILFDGHTHTVDSQGNHTHTLQDSELEQASHVPKFFALAWIMKT